MITCVCKLKKYSRFIEYYYFLLAFCEVLHKVLLPPVAFGGITRVHVHCVVDLFALTCLSPGQSHRDIELS